MEDLLSDTFCKSTGCFVDTYSPARVRWRVLLLCTYIYVAGFDSVSDLVAWGAFLKQGFGHPLLPVPALWSAAWGLFAITGLALALVSTMHEVVRLFELKGGIGHKNFCQSHAELMPLLGLLLEDVPMLVLALLYGLSQYTCSAHSVANSKDVLVPVLISSIATLLATLWRLILTLVKLRERTGDTTCTSTNPSSDSKDMANDPCCKSISRCTSKLSFLRQLVTCCYKTFLLVFGSAVFLLSLLVMSIVVYLMVRQDLHVIHRPHDPLMIFTVSPTHSIINVSMVTENERVSTLHGDYCLITFQYMPTKHKIVYNFADINSHNGSACAEGRKATSCLGRCTNLFYGSYEKTETGRVEKFHEVCLAAHVIVPHVTTTPEWDEDMRTECTLADTE